VLASQEDGLRGLGQGDVVPGVTLAEPPLLAVLLQFLQRVLPDGLEHPVHRSVLVGRHRNQRLLYQAPQQTKHVPGFDTLRGAYLLGGLQYETAREY
jgi:hypothetical protein